MVFPLEGSIQETQWVFQAIGIAGGNKEDTEKRLGSLLKRKTTKLFHDVVNLHTALSDAWALEPTKKEPCQASD